MRTFDRYMLKAFLINYTLSLFVLISLYVTLDLFVNLDEFTEGGKGMLQVVAGIADYYAYNLPLYFTQLSGVITAFAACGTLARMQRQNEITAVLASGTSVFRLAAPIMLAGLVMNLLLVVDYEVVLPRVADKLARQRDDVEGARVYEVWFVRDGENRLVSAQQFQPSEGAVRNMIIMELIDGPDRSKVLGDVITADKAHWDPARTGWSLSRGIRISASSSGRGPFSHHSMERIPVDFYPCTLTPQELQLRQSTQWLRFLSTAQLNLLAKRGDVNSARIAQYKHERFTSPISNMILLVLGMTFFMHRLPDSVLTQGGKALAVCSLSFLVTFAGQQIAGSAALNPALPAWIPIFIFGPVAVLLLDNVKT